MNVGEELQRLVQLRDQGVLSQAEFEREKSRVLRAGQAAAKPAKKRSGLATGCGGVIAIIIVLGVIGSFASNKGGKDNNNSAGTTAVPITVTATDLFDAYHANEVSAQAQYGKGPLIISGVVSSIDLDFANNTVVHLNTPNEFMSAGVTLSEQSAKNAGTLAKGDNVKFLCTGETHLILGSPQLSDCETQ